jgi:hypothetical protein
MPAPHPGLSNPPVDSPERPPDMAGSFRCRGTRGYQPEG